MKIVKWDIQLKQEIEYGFLSFAKNIDKNLSNKYGQKLLDNAKKSAIDAIKTDSKGAIQKTAEATGYLIGYKIADKKASVWKKSKKSHSGDEIEVPKKYTYLQKKENKLLIN